MLPPCACKRKCSEYISKERRESIHAEYWEKKHQERQEFLFQSVSVTEKKRTRVRSKPTKKRTQSRIYTLKIETGDVQQVCSQFFLGTLGFKKDNVISRIFHKQSPRKRSSFASTFSPDQRGRHRPKHKLDEEVRNHITAHILSYHPSVSHHRRKHAPLRTYLPAELTIQEMYVDFKAKTTDRDSYETYRSIVRGMNISFTKLGEEECENV